MPSTNCQQKDREKSAGGVWVWDWDWAVGLLTGGQLGGWGGCSSADQWGCPSLSTIGCRRRLGGELTTACNWSNPPHTTNRATEQSPLIPHSEIWTCRILMACFAFWNWIHFRRYSWKPRCKNLSVMKCQKFLFAKSGLILQKLSLLHIILMWPLRLLRHTILKKCSSWWKFVTNSNII